MTSDEFDGWYAGTFAPTYVAVYRWVEQESPDTAATLRSWYEQLEHLTVVQVNDALALVQSGAEDLGPWQDIPRTLARIARQTAHGDVIGQTKRAIDLAERGIRYEVSRGRTVGQRVIDGVIGFLTRTDATEREREAAEDLRTWLADRKCNV